MRERERESVCEWYNCLPAKGSTFPSFSNKMSDTVHKEREIYIYIETSYIKRVDDTYRMNINENMIHYQTKVRKTVSGSYHL